MTCPKRWFGEATIEEAPIPYACITTNLTNCIAEVHRSGKLRTWVQASCSIPGVYPPVVLADSIHVDGGVVNNLPTDAVRSVGVGFVVAVDVGAGPAIDRSGRRCAPGARPFPTIFELLLQVGTMSDIARGLTAREDDVLIASGALAPARSVKRISASTSAWVMLSPAFSLA